MSLISYSTGNLSSSSTPYISNSAFAPQRSNSSPNSKKSYNLKKESSRDRVAKLLDSPRISLLKRDSSIDSIRSRERSRDRDRDRERDKDDRDRDRDKDNRERDRDRDNRDRDRDRERDRDRDRDRDIDRPKDRGNDEKRASRKEKKEEYWEMDRYEDISRENSFEYVHSDARKDEYPRKGRERETRERLRGPKSRSSEYVFNNEENEGTFPLSSLLSSLPLPFFSFRSPLKYKQVTSPQESQEQEKAQREFLVIITLNHHHPQQENSACRGVLLRGFQITKQGHAQTV